MSSEAQMLLRQARDEFEQWLPAGDQAEGGGGKGRAALTPRIAIFDAVEAATARTGIYVAYVFAADMSTVTLTLNQGIAEIAEHLGRAGARRTLAWEAADIRAALRPKHIADLDTTMDRRSTTPLALDYQRASIVARTYQLDDLPSERTMVADLRRFLRLYDQALTARGRGGQLGKRAFPPVRLHRAETRNAAKPRPQIDEKPKPKTD